MVSSSTIEVPHLGGIKAGYALSDNKYDPSKPTVVMINSMCTTVALYRDQFEDKKLTEAVNLLAIEPLGHGSTSSSAEHFTYWDSAIMALQVMDKLGIKNAFALGTSQGGWVVVRMALLMPEKVCRLSFSCRYSFWTVSDWILQDLGSSSVRNINGLRIRGITSPRRLGTR